MCDTVVVVDPTRGVWLAKNSDREPGEAQLVERVPGMRATSKTMRCTHVEVPTVDTTFAIAISRPHWMWGAEMGVNERGVAIGNEAVFTNAKLDDNGLTGMDLLRLALERASSAREAVDVITRLLRAHGQGGRMGYRDLRFRYSSSFLIADREEAWVLETAGRHFAAERVTSGVRAISNALTIEQADLVDEGSPREFARRYRDDLMSALAGADARRSCTSRRAGPDFASMAAALRDHNGKPLESGLRMSMPCAHASLWPTRSAGQTTASMIAALTPSAPPQVWLTGTSSPCLSVFKKVALDGVAEEGAGADDPQLLFWRHERLHRAVLRAPEHAAAVRAKADALEARGAELADDAWADLWAEHRALVDEWRAAVPAPTARRASPFQLFWRRQDALDADALRVPPRQGPLAPLGSLGLLGAVVALTIASSCAPIAAPGEIPEVVIAERGAGDGPRLLSVQAFMQPADYASAARFEDRLRGLLDVAREAELLDERTVVVLPEYIGSWLVAVDEGPAVFEEPEIAGAMGALALAHLPSFLLRSWTAPVADGDAFAAFTEKSERMAEVYDDVMSTLARDFAVTLVGGSILLPGATLDGDGAAAGDNDGGALRVTPGAALENVSVIYDAAGARIGISRKLFPTADEQGFVSAAESPAELVVVDTPAGRLGVLVCADAWFPQSYQRLADERAQLLAVPTFHSGHGTWTAPWLGYSGHAAPDDVDAADVGVLSEAEAWDKYALAGRAAAAGILGAVSAPLRGALWDLGGEGQAFLVDQHGFARMDDIDGPGLFLLRVDEDVVGEGQGEDAP